MEQYGECKDISIKFHQALEHVQVFSFRTLKRLFYHLVYYYVPS